MGKKTEMTREDKLKELFAELERDAYNRDYHNYYIKQANQIIRKHFERILPSPSSATVEEIVRKLLMGIYNKYEYAIVDIYDFSAQRVAEATKELLKQQDKLQKQLNDAIATLRAIKTVNDAAIKSTDG